MVLSCIGYTFCLKLLNASLGGHSFLAICMCYNVISFTLFRNCSLFQRISLNNDTKQVNCDVGDVLWHYWLKYAIEAGKKA